MAVASRFLKDIDARYLLLPKVLSMGMQNIERFSTNYGVQHKPNNSVPRINKLITPPRTLKKVMPANSVVSSKENLVLPVNVGQCIEHERFGRGKVVNVEGVGDNAKATIEFANVGVKQLLLRFARFKIVE